MNPNLVRRLTVLSLSSPSPSAPMAKLSPAEVGTRLLSCGMCQLEQSCALSKDILVLSTQWPSVLTGRFSPAEVARGLDQLITPSGCGMFRLERSCALSKG